MKRCIDTICEVCFLVYGDESVKKSCYCSMCDAYICVKCENKVSTRIIASIKKAFAGKEKLKRLEYLKKKYRTINNLK